MEIAIDPGTSVTGVAAFSSGKVVARENFKGKGVDAWAKRRRISSALIKWLRWQEDVFGPVSQFAVEKWVGGVQPKRVKTHGVLCETRGFIVGTIEALWPEALVTFHGKGFKPKNEGAVLVDSLKLPVNTDDESDAVLIGAIAGFLE